MKGRVCVLLLAVSIVSLLLVNQVYASGKGESESMEGSAILLVSFGSSYADALKTIESFGKNIRESYPDMHVELCFTSEIIRNILLKRDNKTFKSPVKAIGDLIDEGYKKIVVQSMHVIPGLEYDYLLSIVDGFSEMKDVHGKPLVTLSVGKPLLWSLDDFKSVTEALKSSIQANLSGKSAVVFMGHGTPHFANACYGQLAYMLKIKYGPVFIGTVEGFPGIDEIISQLKELSVTNVILIPFMIVAGDHATNDLAGDEDASWKSILIKNGFSVSADLRGIGDNPSIIGIFKRHIDDALGDIRQ